MKIVVLGAGRVGRAIARDLAADPALEVTAVDLSARAVEALRGVRGVSSERADLADPTTVAALARQHDLVIGAVPGFLGFQTVRTVIEAGRNIVDISFFDEDPFALDAIARANGVVAIVDAGVAPGCSNLILGRVERTLDRTDRFACYVGGLPVRREWPYEYKAPFSPIDVIEEYTRPARLRRHGEAVTLPALSEPELLDLPEIGTLEAFNTDGLRTLLVTSQASTLVEKTLRYPGHADRMRMLRASGFFDETAIEIDGAMVRPRAVTARLLFRAWEFEEGEPDLTVMRIEIEGERGGRRERHLFDLLDRYDPATGISSMARTTGYTCTALARTVARGMYTQTGIAPPELVGRDPECYAFVMGELRARGIRFRETVVPA